jgi:flavin reductase (DIM6/NTAB) family NADH-FMN oxidoreductase RutF
MPKKMGYESGLENCEREFYQQNDYLPSYRMKTISIDPKEVSVARMHGYLLGAVAPRPVAFASTIDKQGNVNLSPFSFFNCFGANPPILIFSPARRGRDNTTKHSFENVLEVPEVVINIVNYAMVEQMSLASTEYDKGVNEFIKSGLTPVVSDLVKPPRVGESPASFECKVLEVKSMGSEGGAGNLVICEVIKAHLSENILDDMGNIDPFRLDAVARMGGNWYCRAQGDALFEIPKPLATKGIGIDQLPESIRLSQVLTGNELARLANVEAIPEKSALPANLQEELLTIQTIEERHTFAKSLLKNGNLSEAWQVLLA